MIPPPVGHAAQAVLPAFGLNDPAGQAAHVAIDEAPTAAEKVPAAQGLQTRSRVDAAGDE